ncbi:MAG: hypothetical protein WA941_17350, partial [Nitrososphaeraceae archaeon]
SSKIRSKDKKSINKNGDKIERTCGAAAEVTFLFLSLIMIISGSAITLIASNGITPAAFAQSQGEICDDNMDNDGDGLIDAADEFDCLGNMPHVLEICDDGIDNDGDGVVDANDDEDCIGNMPVPNEICNDGIDNDLDGKIDGEDVLIDNDGDGRIERPDKSFCPEGSPVPREVCDDGIDNDGDGLVDGNDDEDCLGNEPLPMPPQIGEGDQELPPCPPGEVTTTDCIPQGNGDQELPPCPPGEVTTTDCIPQGNGDDEPEKTEDAEDRNTDTPTSVDDMPMSTAKTYDVVAVIS